MRIEKYIAELNCLKELINYRKSSQENKNGVDSKVFVSFVNEFFQNVADELGEILTEVLSENDLKIDIERRISHAHHLYFHINGNTDVFYKLYKGKIYRVGKASTPFFGKQLIYTCAFLEEELTNSKSEELLKLSNAYTDLVINVLDKGFSIHLTKNLELNCTFVNGAHLYIYDEKRGYSNSYKVLERKSFLPHNNNAAHRQMDPRIDDVILINKLPSVGIIDDKDVQRYIEKKKSAKELLSKLREELGIQVPEQSEGNEEVKELKKN